MSRTTSGSFIVARAGCTITKKARELDPPIAECCRTAPPILVFDQAGNLLRHWGGPGQGYEWPESNHGMHIDYKGNVWIGGNGQKDAQVLKFTKDGKFLMQVGHLGKKPAATTLENFWRVAKIWVDPKTNEAYVADGYGNKSVAVLDADTGKMKRYWGAYGNKPDDADLGKYDPKAPPAQQFRNPVHCVERSNDGLVYVCDRAGDRVQVFQPDGKFVKEGFYRQGHAGLGFGVGPDVLKGSRSSASFSWPTARTKKSASFCARRWRNCEFRRRRAPARPVLRRAQHRDRFEGQSLHDRNLRRKARAEIHLQRHRPGRPRSQGVLWPK